jgi:hypothetical protein
MNAFAHILIFTVQLWRPASQPISHPSGGIVQHMTQALTKTRQADRRLQEALEEAVLLCA